MKNQKRSRRKRREESFPSRLRLALLVVGVPLVMLGVGKVIPEASMADQLSDSPYEGQQVSFDSLLSETLIRDVRQHLPENFEKEFFGLNSFSNIQVSKTGRVVGFFSPDEPGLVFKECSQHLTEKGWIRVESGYETAATFVKKGGKHQWLFFSCVLSCGETSAVMRLA